MSEEFNKKIKIHLYPLHTTIMTIAQLLQYLEAEVPLDYQDDWDNSGLQVGDTDQPLKGILIALDTTEAVIMEAIEKGCNLILTHHPLLFHATKCISKQDYVHRCVMMAIKHDIVLYATHTNLDNHPEGINGYWGKKMGLQETRTLLCRPNTPSVGAGIIGMTPKPLTLQEIIERMKTFQPIQAYATSKELHQTYKCIAFGGGSCGFLIREAAKQGAEVFITGEAKYNDYYDAQDLLTLVTVGHFESEEHSKEILYSLVSKKRGNFVIHRATACANPITYF